MTAPKTASGRAPGAASPVDQANRDIISDDLGSTLFVDAPGEVREMLRLLTNVVLFSVFVNELIGPLISRFGIVRGAARL